MTEQTFKVGDVIKVKGQDLSPILTITEIDLSNPPDINCIYWNSVSNKFEYMTFHSFDCLEKDNDV